MQQSQEPTVQVDFLSHKKCILSNIPPSAHSQLSQIPSLSFFPPASTYLASPNDLNFIRRSLSEMQISLQQIPHQVIELFTNLNRRTLKKFEILPEKIGPWVLWPHQVDAVASFGRKGGQIVLGDGWSKGKTVTAIALLHCYKFQRAVVVCQETMALHWKNHLLLSRTWAKEEVFVGEQYSQFTLRNQKFKGCFVLTFEQMRKVKFDPRMIDCLIADEPLSEDRIGESFKAYKHLVVLCRRGIHKLSKLLPLFCSSVNSSFLKQRYRLMSVGIATQHTYEFKELRQSLVYTGREGIAVSCLFKPIPLLISEPQVLQQAVILQQAFRSKVSKVISYLQFLIENYEEKVTVLYSLSEVGKSIRSCFGERITLLPYERYLQLVPFKGTLVMLEPFFRKDQAEARILYSKVATITKQVEYFQLFFSDGDSRLKTFFVYPDILTRLQVEALCKKREEAKKKVTVFFDIETPQQKQIEIEESLPEINQKENGYFQTHQTTLPQLSNQQRQTQQNEVIEISFMKTRSFPKNLGAHEPVKTGQGLASKQQKVNHIEESQQTDLPLEQGPQLQIYRQIKLYINHRSIMDIQTRVDPSPLAPSQLDLSPPFQIYRQNSVKRPSQRGLGPKKIACQIQLI